MYSLYSFRDANIDTLTFLNIPRVSRILKEELFDHAKVTY